MIAGIVASGRLSSGPPPEPGWTILPTFPSSSTFIFPSGLVEIGGYLYVYEGGFNNLQRFKLSTGTWETVTPSGTLPAARSNPSVQAANGKLYSFGGQLVSDSSRSQEMWEYDPAANLWSKKANATFTSGSRLCILNPNNIIEYYVDNSATVFTYNPTTNAYGSRGALPAIIVGPGVLQVEDDTYVYAGKTGTTDRNILLRRSSTVTAWTSLASWNPARNTVGMFSLADKLYSLNGTASPALTDSNRYAEYSILGNTWQDLSVAEPNFPSASFAMLTCKVGESVYILQQDKTFTRFVAS